MRRRAPLSRVEPRVRVAHDEPVDAPVRRNEEAPEHAADLAARRARQLGRRAVHVHHLGAVMPQQPLHVLWHGAVKVHADRPAREDERRELRVAQHARRVPRVAAVQPEGHDSLLVGRGERVDAHHLLHQRQPPRRQPRRIGGERSAHALYSVPPLPHPHPQPQWIPVKGPSVLKDYVQIGTRTSPRDDCCLISDDVCHGLKGRADWADAWGSRTYFQNHIGCCFTV